MSNLENLTKLSLHHNALLAIPSGFSRLVNLKFLDISFNAVTSLPPTIFDKLCHLESLVVDSNQLSELPSLEGLVELHHLSAANNVLVLLPKSLCSCTKLMTVEVAGNQIKELSEDAMWCNLGHLQRFNLCNNKLTAVPGALSDCKKLKELLLAGNPLKDNRLKKLATDSHSGSALMNYISKMAKSGGGRRDKSGKRGARAASRPSRRNFKPDVIPSDQPMEMAENIDDIAVRLPRLMARLSLSVSGEWWLIGRAFACGLGSIPSRCATTPSDYS